MAEGNMRDREFIGQGLSFPLQFDARGRLSLTRGGNEIEQSIRIILETSPGERVMRPNFGCRAWELVFAPRNATTEATLINYVQEALILWEPRIDLVGVEIVDDSAYDDSVLLVAIRYRIKNTHDERSIVYPFYVMSEG
jgi:uncharacterized protein